VLSYILKDNYSLHRIQLSITKWHKNIKAKVCIRVCLCAARQRCFVFPSVRSEGPLPWENLLFYNNKIECLSVCDADGCPPPPHVVLFVPRLLTFLEEMESLLRRGDFCLSFSGRLMAARSLCIKLLPALPSTVTLDFGPRRAHDQYFLSHNCTSLLRGQILINDES
jgi:hypothetical protein